MTWASRPRGLAYGRALAWHARPGSWLTVDITSFALSRGIFSLALSPRAPRAGVAFASRDARAGARSARTPAHRPRLVVTTTAPGNLTPPTLSGRAYDGGSLAAAPGTWSGSTPIAYTYRWQRCLAGTCNVAFAWTGKPPYGLLDGAAGGFSHNVEYGGTTSCVPSSVLADPLQLRRADPFFASPPPVDPTLDQQQRTALLPWNIGSRLTPQAASPLIDAGIDPRTAAGVTPELRAGMDRFLGTDIAGAVRPSGIGWDIGAYER